MNVRRSTRINPGGNSRSIANEAQASIDELHRLISAIRRTTEERSHQASGGGIVPNISGTPGRMAGFEDVNSLGDTDVEYSPGEIKVLGLIRTILGVSYEEGRTDYVKNNQHCHIYRSKTGSF
jgi:hypothetical protein